MLFPINIYQPVCWCFRIPSNNNTKRENTPKITARNHSSGNYFLYRKVNRVIDPEAELKSVRSSQMSGSFDSPWISFWPKLRKVTVRISQTLHFRNQKNELRIYCEFRIHTSNRFRIVDYELQWEYFVVWVIKSVIIICYFDKNTYFWCTCRKIF